MYNLKIFPEMAMKKENPNNSSIHPNGADQVNQVPGEVFQSFKTPAQVNESGYERVSSFRQKLATEDLNRYEVYISRATRQGIKDIAVIEGISAGIAGEALLKLGIESYHNRSSSFFTGPNRVAQSASTVPNAFHERHERHERDEHMSGVKSASANASASLGSEGLSKGLALYTDRSSPRANALSAKSSSQVTRVTKNLIEAAKRKASK